MRTREEILDELHRAKIKYNTLIANGLVGKARTSRRLIAHYERLLERKESS